MLRAIVSDLAELLIRSDMLQELGNHLERKGIFNNLRSGMEEEKAAERLFELVRDFNLLSSEEWNEGASVSPEDRGEWALTRLQSNLSNEDA